MTDAQAVLNAMYEVNMDFGEENAKLAAAALRAVANQVAPETNVDEADYDCLHAKWADQGKEEARAQILAIAAELEAS